MTTKVVFIGGPLDLQRLEVNHTGRYYRHVNAPRSGFTDAKPVRPEPARDLIYADYEITTFHRAPGQKPILIGMLMEIPCA